MSELSESEVFHIEKWADTGNGYVVRIKYQVLCLWCDYYSLGTEATDAIRQYHHEHEDVIRAKADEARRDYLGS